MRETTEPHTRLLRMGLAVEESREYWRHDPPYEVETAFEERWFGSRSLQRVRYLMTNFAYRFDAVTALRKQNPDDAPVLCHWHLQLSDPLYRSFTDEHLTERRQHPEPTVDRNAVIRWLEKQRDWATTTTHRMAAGLMSVLNEAGFTKGIQPLRTLHTPKTSDKALAYLLYLLRETEFTGTLDKNPYLTSLNKTIPPRLPGIRYHMGELAWEYPTLEEWANHE